ncbi:hypothetical protein Bbelb_120080 [Branchiostoma belcheri]|nr:hypothetical protein Bbelb_120080 [Branchiostoma belcheri]
MIDADAESLASLLSFRNSFGAGRSRTHHVTITPPVKPTPDWTRADHVTGIAPSKAGRTDEQLVSSGVNGRTRLFLQTSVIQAGLDGISVVTPAHDEKHGYFELEYIWQVGRKPRLRQGERKDATFPATICHASSCSYREPG